MDTEYLIMHEDSIDWEQLSRDPDRSFSLAEIRMFRKRINWCEYMKNHDMSPAGLEIASKHFREQEYNLIALLNIGSDDFILNHQDRFDWNILLESHMLKSKTIMDCLDSWKGIPKSQVERALTENHHIDLYDGQYDDVLLYLGLKQ